ncbi:MAG: hypothetical protein ACTSRZ_10725 [Promethearchaeota archaeon]
MKKHEKKQTNNKKSMPIVKELNLGEICEKIKEQKLKVVNINIKFIIWGIIFLVLGIISALIFGISPGRNIEYGAVFGFEGLSWFYINGLPLLVISMSNLVYVLLSADVYKFNFKKPNILTIKQQKLFIRKTVRYKLDKSNISGILIKNTDLKYRIIWIFIIFPYCFLDMRYGISTLNAYHIFDSKIFSVVSFMNIFYSIISLIFLVTILFQNNIELLIYTQVGLLYALFPDNNRKFIKEKLIPKLCEFIIGHNEISNYNLKICESSYNFTKFYSGVLLFIFGIIQLNVISIELAFFDIISGYLIIIISLILIITGLQERSLIALQDLPQEFPSLYCGAYYFEFQIKISLSKFYSVQSEQYFDYKWYEFLIFYFTLIWISRRAFEILIGGIVNPMFLWRSIITFAFYIIDTIIILRFLFEKKIWYSFKFLEFDIKYPVFRKFKKKRMEFKYFINQFKILFNLTNIKNIIKSKRGILTLISITFGIFLCMINIFA